MKQVNIKLKEIRVNNFYPKDRTVEIDVLFNDGSLKEITKKVEITDPEGLASQIVQQIRDMEKGIHQRFTGESILDGVVNIILPDEDKVVQKMIAFFCKVCDKISDVKNCSICLGASNLKVVELLKDNDSINIGQVVIENHECNPRKKFMEVIRKLDISKYDYVTITGRRFKDQINLHSITEPEATENAIRFINKDNKRYNALVSLGGENFILYVLNEKGHLLDVQTGNKCASGTGEFFLQQIRRMNLSVDDATKVAKNSKQHKVSGRCSVFCKSDCTHALNKGIPKGEVTAGLCNMMAEKVFDLMQTTDMENVIAVGGVAAKNHIVTVFLKERIKNLVIPKEADYFEALGAALYAMEKKTRVNLSDELLKHEKSSFHFLEPIQAGESLVSFKEMETDKAKESDECIIGLDVGSTTTKSVLLRTKDNKVVASIYLRTNGDPVGASRNCYRELSKQVDAKINIIGLGSTGSGRKIAGLHAMTDAVINEIISHATAAVYFDKDVDTIFEIGGQDAKYTYLVNSVPSDYAMNEACSAGTGSFLEEAAKESLGIDYLQIAEIALKGKNPPNFNDQCAAFISSDIKNASHEGINQEDIVAGLIYSICMNYDNRVKGSRPVGNKIFMQGGVCYNKAVPLAMANLINKHIIVPPEPGLMGAFGVALEVKKRIELGLLKKKEFNLKNLYEREVEYKKSFICHGEDECDRKCEINMISIEGKDYPFGGICDKYYNIAHNIKIDSRDSDIINKRQDLVFNQKSKGDGPKKIGISRSFLANSLYPLYHNFFSRLGLDVVLSDNVDPEGVKMARSSFCFPAQISHGTFYNLLHKDLDYIFLPTIYELHVENSVDTRKDHQSPCYTIISEVFFIKSTFKDIKTNAKLLTPVLDFSKGWDSEGHAFAKLAKNMGFTKQEGAEAFDFAIEKQKEFFNARKEIGKKVLEELEKDPTKTAIVLFGRPYNAFADEANMGIPNKFASRGFKIIPFDFLSYKDEPCDKSMHWALGQEILKAASFVKKHPQLFGAYITNFSCGPDSFIVGYFRDIMKTKPSLTLELDSHTADAGVNTRIEAFLDIVERYRKIGVNDPKPGSFRKAQIVIRNGNLYYLSSDGNEYPLKNNKRVHVLFPSMGRTFCEGVAATFKGIGYNSSSVALPDMEVLQKGRGNTSCKECLPLILTTGSLLNYLENRKNKDELLVYFMPTAPGGCRFGQYNVFINKLIEKKQIKDVALVTLTQENSYAGIKPLELIKMLKSITIADVMDDIHNAIYVLAEDREYGIKVFNKEWQRIKDTMSVDGDVYNTLKEAAHNLSKVPLKQKLSDVKSVIIMGEIYVRKDEFSNKDLINRLASKGIVAKRSPILDWIYYIDYTVKHGINDARFTLKDKIEFYAKLAIQRRTEKTIKRILSKSGLYHYELIEMDKMMEYGQKFVDKRLGGEPIIMLGAFFKDILHSCQGVISIGPFGCMPTKVIEAILTKESTLDNKIMIEKDLSLRGKYPPKLPFLSLESDGNPFPQIIGARIEAFCLQVQRIHEIMNKK
jgi:predicted CoA-substrate-specific enzyme activase